MEKNYSIAIIGGDYRMISCAKSLSKIGYKVSVFGYEDYNGNYEDITVEENLSVCIDNADILVLPLPYTDKDGNIRCAYTQNKIKATDIIKLCKDKKMILGGCLSKEFISECNSHGIEALDYYESEELKVLNAIPTAEGAIAIAILETDITLHGCECAVLSFGCVGRATARALYGLGARVTVVARSVTALSKSESLGYNAVHISDINKALQGKKLIFNAIPAQIITESVIKDLDENTIIIDLASKPGGVDVSSAESHNVRVISALSLPSKYAPVTAGCYLAKTIDHILKGVE